MELSSEQGHHRRRADEAPPREIHLKDLWAVVVRHWRLVVLLTTLVVSGTYFSGRGAVAQYQSRLTVQVSSPKQVFARFDDIDFDELALRTDPILSEALVLTTHALALRVVDALQLRLEVTDLTIPRAEVFTSIAIDSLVTVGEYQLVQFGTEGGWELLTGEEERLSSGSYAEVAQGPGFSFRVIPTTEAFRTVAFRVVPSAQAAGWVSGGITYQVRAATNAVDITFTGTDRSLVPLILNQAGLELRRDGAERARRAAIRRREFIGEQLTRAELQSRAKLSELQQFKEQQRITDLTAEEEALVGSITEFEQQKQEIHIRRSTLRAALGSADTIGIETLNRLAAVEGTASNTVLAFQIGNLLELHEERRSQTAGVLGLRENNPQVQALDQRILQSNAALRAAVTAALEGLRVREQAIDDKIAELRDTLMAFPGKETRVAQLLLEGSILEDTYRYLLGQFEQAQLQEGTITPYVSILDGASPPFRIGTNLRQKVLLGMLVGLLLGLGGAFFLEYLDQTIKSATDIERAVGMPVLGLIPLERKLAGAGNSGNQGPIIVLTALKPDDPAVEAYRALRTNVTFVGAESPLQFIIVTSPGPGEGKSTTAANLALTLAQGGSRTLLIDGDLRRPQLHRAFALVQEPGLTDVLINKASVREAVRPDVAPNLDVLPAGATPPNPSELLGSDVMHRVLAELRRDYTYILMDTPPSLPVTDAIVLATAADATILVMRSGETEEASAQRAVDQLRRVRARIAGAVLNGVSQRHDHYYSYYSYGGGSEAPARSPVRSLRARLAGLF